jgi:hypothetical protein
MKPGPRSKKLRPLADAHYYELLDLVTKAGWEAMAHGTRVNEYPPYRKALRRVRAYTEICDCIEADFLRAFPELATIKTTVVPLSELEFVDD